MLLNSKQFNFNFFLSNRTKVQSLESGAKQYHGATAYNDAIYSNIEGTDYIEVNETNNTLAVFIPSTINVNEQIDNKYYIAEVIKMIRSLYSDMETTYYNTSGSWLDDNTNTIIYDNITIVSINLQTVTEADITNMVNIANWIKYNMQQQGVSININNSLAII